jgi:thymidylate synthase (FAD)
MAITAVYQPRVVLLDAPSDPLAVLYRAFRTCYSEKPTDEIELPPREKMEEFCQRWLAVGHTSPLEQVVYRFAISGVSRAFSHQFVRHRVGVSVEQQSQRYVDFEDLDVVVPPSIAKHGVEGAMAVFSDAMIAARDAYRRLLEAGIPAEDARFVLPQAVSTNLVVTINLAALKHMAGLRLCTRAQWEFRHVVAKMRAEVVRREPLFADLLMPKCYPWQYGACDEDIKAYRACPLSKVRPHKWEATHGPGPEDSNDRGGAEGDSRRGAE